MISLNHESISNLLIFSYFYRNISVDIDTTYKILHSFICGKCTRLLIHYKN